MSMDVALERPASSGPSRAALLARLLTAVTLLALLIGAAVVAVQWEPRLLPIRVVVCEGEMHGLSRESLTETIASHIDGGILTQDLRVLQRQVEELPWIDRVTLRRVWPDRIEVTVREHEALARWGENGLVTAAGVVFRPRDGRLPAGLAQLDASDDALAPEVVARFQDWGTRLMTVGLILEAVRRDARGDWTLRLLGGTAVQLGTEDLEARIDRLIAAYPQVEAIGVPASLDLRYSNGLAVRWVPILNSRGAERVAVNQSWQRS